MRARLVTETRVANRAFVFSERTVLVHVFALGPQGNSSLPRLKLLDEGSQACGQHANR